MASARVEVVVKALQGLGDEVKAAVDWFETEAEKCLSKCELPPGNEDLLDRFREKLATRMETARPGQPEMLARSQLEILVRRLEPFA